MQKLFITGTHVTPEINFNPGKNDFYIRGTSSPEDVRALYYPAIEWIKKFSSELIEEGDKIYNDNNPLRFRIDLTYFNSSSAKFLYDIIFELKKIADSKIPVNIEWCYDEEDSDMREAGSDIALLANMEFMFIAKPADSQ